MSLSEFADREWRDLIATDFLFLERIPSSWPRASVAIYRKLPDKYDFAYLKKRREGALSYEENHKLLLLCGEERNGISYMPFKDRRRLIDQMLATSLEADQRELLEQLKREYQNATTPNAKDIRRILFPKLRGKLGQKESGDGGGSFRFPLPFRAGSGSLNFDFGGMRVFSYWIDLPDARYDETTRRFISYERLLGFGDPDWDLLRSDRLDQDSDFFLDVLDKLMAALETPTGS